MIAQKVGSLNNLLRVFHAVTPLRSERNAPIGTVEQAHAELLFRIAYGGRHGGLGDEQRLRRPRNGTETSHLQYIAQVLYCHIVLPSYIRFTPPV